MSEENRSRYRDPWRLKIDCETLTEKEKAVRGGVEVYAVCTVGRERRMRFERERERKSDRARIDHGVAWHGEFEANSGPKDGPMTMTPNNPMLGPKDALREEVSKMSRVEFSHLLQQQASK